MAAAEQLAALAVLAGLHLIAGRLRFLRIIPRSRWLSFAGGVSVAYVFAHLLPELAAGQAAVEKSLPGLEYLEDHVFLMALAGFALFYGVEVASRRSNGGEGGATGQVFWLSIASFALYNALIGYLVVHREDDGGADLVLFTAALGVHFMINDLGLRSHHREAYDRTGRWLLVAAIAIGWAVGEATSISNAAVALIIAFVGGGVILNVLKEELPEERRSSFAAFAAGTVGYAILLQTI